MYPVPQLRGVKHRTVTTLHTADEVFDIIEILDTKYAGQDIGFDVEASDLAPNQFNWDFTGFSFSVLEKSEGNEWLGRSWYFDFKYPNKYLSKMDSERLAQWMDKNSKRLWAFNCSYELKACWRLLGHPLLFRDARGLTLAGDIRGGLKAIVQRYCCAHEWETDNGGIVSAIQQMRNAINKLDSNKVLPGIRQRRYDIVENSKYLEKDIYKFLTPVELDFLMSNIDFPRIKRYMNCIDSNPSEPVYEYREVLKKSSRKKQKKFESATSSYHEAVAKGDTPAATVYLEVMQENALTVDDYEKESYEVRLSMTQQAVMALLRLNLTEREILETFTGLTGWYGVPSRILGVYCCWDTYYTLVLRKVIGSDPRLEKAAPYFEQEVRFAGVLESYNQTWSEEIAEELNQNYLKLMGDGLHECIFYIGKQNHSKLSDDEFGCWNGLYEKLARDCELPMSIPMKRWVGGTYVSAKTTRVTRPGLLEKHLSSYASVLETDDEELKKEYNEYGLRILLEDQEIPITPDQVRAMPEEQYPLRLIWKVLKGKKKSVEEYSAVIENQSDRIAWLKDIWNPGSPAPITAETFMKGYLTPKIITANLFYGMRRVLLTAQVWELLDGKMVEIEEQETNEDGTLKFDEDGEPIFKKEKRPCKIEILKADGSIQVIEEFLINMKDLQSTLGNLMALLEMFEHIPMSLIDMTYSAISGLTEEQKEERRKLKDIYDQNRVMKTAIQESIDGLSRYLDNQCGQGISGGVVIEQYSVMTDFLGLNCDDPSTWFDEFRLLLGLRIYKKAYKARNTYIVGAKLGRGQVFEVMTPDEKGMDELPDNWHSHTMPIYREPIKYDEIGSDVWREKDRKRKYSLQEQFKPCATETRRWKSRQHTVPTGSELRKIYIPRKKGWLSSHADFSGCELATCAAIANEQVIIKTFQTGGDIHMNTASGVFGRPPSEISPMQRRWAKTCTFLCLYGGTVETLARELGGQMDRAQFVMNGFFETYPNLENYISSYRQHAIEKGYVFTLNGAPLNLDTSDLAKLSCTAINYPIQSSATNTCGSTFYSMWETLFFDLKLPFVACGFTHDSIDSSYPIQAMFLTIPMQKYLAEYIPWTRFGVPARLDNEIGIDAYSLCHVAVKSTITSGNTIDNPHICEIGGIEKDVLPIVDMMKEYFDNVEIEYKYGKKKPHSMSELWLGSRAIDDSQLTHFHPGTYDTKLDVVIKCTNKEDSPFRSPVYGDHPEFNNCITYQVINMLQKGKV